MLLHTSPPIDAPQRHGDYTDARRTKLSEFGDKFSQYSSSFNPPALIRHLQFYKATHRILTAIEPEFVKKNAITGHKSPTPGVRVFLTKALIRFQKWLSACLSVRESNEPLNLFEVPPIDVLVILHAYLLSPWTFDEDATLRFPELRHIARFPLEHMEILIDNESGEYVPTSAQISFWESTTGAPFDVRDHTALPTVRCPTCNGSDEVPWTEASTPRSGGRGFAETGFYHECSTCGFAITRDALATKKFVDDLAAAQAFQHLPIAGTTLEGIGDVQLETAGVIAADVIRTLGDTGNKLAETLGWSMEEVRVRILNDPLSKISKTKVDDLLRPYTQSSPFSADLVYKALLQGEFSNISAVKGMYDRDMLNGNRLSVLEEAIRAYRLFVKLVLLPDLPKVYPTYAVDLVWHTHQLQGTEYKRQIKDMVDVFLDHQSVDQLAPTGYIFDEQRDAWRAVLRAAGLTENVLDAGSPPENGTEGGQGIQRPAPRTCGCNGVKSNCKPAACPSLCTAEASDCAENTVECACTNASPGTCTSDSGCNCGDSCGACSQSSSQMFASDFFLGTTPGGTMVNPAQPTVMPPAEQLKILLQDSAFNVA